MISKKGDLPVRNATGVVILLFMMIGILFYLLVVPQSVREDILEPINAGETIPLLDVVPGQLNIGSEKARTERINLPLVELNNNIESSEISVSDKFSVKNSLFSAQAADFSFLITDKNLVDDIKLRFSIVARNGEGPLKVKVNDITVFSAIANRGDEFTVNLPLSIIKSGKNNVRFLVASSGTSFWKSTSYLVSGVTLVTKEYNTDSSIIDQSFSLSKSKLSRTQEASLSGSVITKGEKVKLKVSLNSYTLFEGNPGASLDLDIPIAMLREGSNTLTWSVERGGKYDIEFVKINLETLDVTGDTTADYTFDISDKNWNFLVRNADAICQLYIKKHSGTADDITVQLNQYTLKYHFGASEVNADICNYLYTGSNSISLSANDELLLSKLYVAIKT